MTRGRRAEAVRNDERILHAARDILTVAPDASMAQIAARAGVGIGTLYRRYPSRDALVAQLCLHAVRQVEAEAYVALDRARAHPWGAFVGFMTKSVTDGAGSLAVALAGTFSPTDELRAAAQSLHQAVEQLLDCAQAASAVRADLTTEDVGLLLEQLRAVRVADPDRAATLRRRYLWLALQALHAQGAAPLPGPPPAWEEIRGRWDD
jgi:AcrR family transcriptional regulator